MQHSWDQFSVEVRGRILFMFHFSTLDTAYARLDYPLGKTCWAKLSIQINKSLVQRGSLPEGRDCQSGGLNPGACNLDVGALIIRIRFSSNYAIIIIIRNPPKKK